MTRRIGFPIAAYLLGGALATIAIAWVATLLEPRTFASFTHNIAAMKPVWERYEVHADFVGEVGPVSWPAPTPPDWPAPLSRVDYGGTGYRRSSATSCFGGSLSVVRVPDEQVKAIFRSAFDSRCAVEVCRCGWPAAALQARYVAEGDSLCRWDVHADPVIRRGDGALWPQIGAFSPEKSGQLPLVPVPTGFALDTVVFASCGWLGTRSPSWARRIHRRRRGLCPSCGYALTGLAPETPCPECGGRA
jgi:hypothetical protein